MPTARERVGKHVAVEIDSSKQPITGWQTDVSVEINSWKPIGHCVMNKRFLVYETERYFLCR
jgi:hypothetical protein